MKLTELLETIYQRDVKIGGNSIFDLLHAVKEKPNLKKFYVLSPEGKVLFTGGSFEETKDGLRLFNPEISVFVNSKNLQFFSGRTKTGTIKIQLTGGNQVVLESIQ